MARTAVVVVIAKGECLLPRCSNAILYATSATAPSCGQLWNMYKEMAETTEKILISTRENKRKKNEKDLCYYLLYSPTSSPNIFKTSIFLNSLHDQYLILMTHVIWMRMKQWHRQKLARKKTFFFFQGLRGPDSGTKQTRRRQKVRVAHQ